MMTIKHITDFLKNKSKETEPKEQPYFDDEFFLKLKDFLADRDKLRATGKTTIISEILLDLALERETNAIKLFDETIALNDKRIRKRQIFNRIVELTQIYRMKFGININLLWNDRHPGEFAARFLDYESMTKYRQLKEKYPIVFTKEFYESLQS